MRVFNRSARKICATTIFAISVAAAAPTDASVIQLGFILDSSGSIGAGDWNIIRNGLSNAISTLIPIDGADDYEVSVVAFSTSASVVVNHVLIDNATARTNVANLVANNATNPFLGGSTNYAAAFTLMQSTLTSSSNFADAAFSYVNLATDGEPNTGGNGVSQRNAMIGAGIDNLSIEGIGISAGAATFLRNSICSPQPCDSSVPFNFPTQGFYIGVSDAQGYANAIGYKIQIVTEQTPTVPEPGTLALLSLGVAVLAASRQRKAPK